MPDGELSDLADAGRLHEPEVLAIQVRRMLADPKSRAMAEDFAGQWLRVGSLADLAEPDKRLFPEYTPELRDAMVEEAVSFVPRRPPRGSAGPRAARLLLHVPQRAAGQALWHRGCGPAPTSAGSS